MEKPTLKKYWEANSSTERIEIVEKAFALIDELEKQLFIQRVVRPNLNDKHPIEGVNETMQTEPKISKSQVVCDGCGDVGVRYLTNVGNYCFFCDPT